MAESHFIPRRRQPEASNVDFGRVDLKSIELPRSKDAPLARWLIIAVSTSYYLVSLDLPAGEMGTVFGSLGPLAVVIFRPLWWANPLFALGLFSLSIRWFGTALLCSGFATLLALSFLLDLDRSGPGCWFWLTSMVVLAVGSLSILFWATRSR